VTSVGYWLTSIVAYLVRRRRGAVHVHRLSYDEPSDDVIHRVQAPLQHGFVGPEPSVIRR